MVKDAQRLCKSVTENRIDMRNKAGFKSGISFTGALLPDEQALYLVVKTELAHGCVVGKGCTSECRALRCWIDSHAVVLCSHEGSFKTVLAGPPSRKASLLRGPPLKGLKRGTPWLRAGLCRESGRQASRVIRLPPTLLQWSDEACKATNGFREILHYSS
jgi:hypothetical protein